MLFIWHLFRSLIHTHSTRHFMYDHKKQYHSLFLKKYYDAIKKMDTTNTPHPTFFEFIKKIHSCLQQNPLSIEKISEALKLSKQMQIQPPSNHDALTHKPI